MREDKRNGLIEIARAKRGDLDTLTRKIGYNLVKEFKEGGLINFGYSSTAKTWRISNLGYSYVSDLKLCQ